MSPQEAAAILNNCEYGSEGSRELWASMKADGLVAVFGASDDLMELRGAIDDEVGCYDGGSAFVSPKGLLKDGSGIEIKALWCAAPGEPCWTYETAIPHVCFNVLEDGEPTYGRGIVFALTDTAHPTPSDPKDRRIEALEEALLECIEVLAMAEQPAFPDTAHHDEVKRLGERIGFGALMSTASAGWREVLAEKGYLVGSEHVSGPCHATVVATLKCARQALQPEPTK